MTQYHYSDGQNQFGPFNLDELKDKKITKDTPIWYEGLENWTKASEINELSALFKSIPPPLTKTPPPLTPPIETKSRIQSSVSSEKKKSNKTLYYFLGGAFVLGIILFAVFLQKPSTSNNNGSYNKDIVPDSWSNNSNPSNSQTQNTNYTPPKEKSPEELRIELYNKEKRKPNDYLSVTSNFKAKVFSNKDEIKGRIYNSATMATFKDVVLIVTYSSGTNTELRKDEYVIYKYVYPNSSTEYGLKVTYPKGTKQYNVSVKTAKAE